MKWNRRFVGVGFALLVTVGCSSNGGAERGGSSAASGAGEALPKWANAPAEHSDPSCGGERSIAEVGTGSTMVEAENRARAAVARQIQSKITVEVDRLVRLSSQDKKAFRQLEQRVSDKASFGHGELIRKIDTATDGKVSVVLACLDRDRAADRVRTDMSDAHALFDGSSARALEALDAGDNQQFTAAYREASKSVGDVMSGYALFSALSGSPSAHEGLFRERWEKILSAAARLRNSARISLIWFAKGFGEGPNRAAQEKFRFALAASGVSTALAPAACAPKEPGLYAVTVKADANCRWASLGHMCEPKFDVEARSCASDRVLFHTNVDGASGLDTRDVGRALDKAVKKLDPAEVERLIGEQMATELPLEVGGESPEG